MERKGNELFFWHGFVKKDKLDFKLYNHSVKFISSAREQKNKSGKECKSN